MHLLYQYTRRIKINFFQISVFKVWILEYSHIIEFIVTRINNIRFINRTTTISRDEMDELYFRQNQINQQYFIGTIK